jgi:hypothetical protein
MMKGYVSILAALILLVVTGGIATTMLLVSSDNLRSGEALRQGEQALLLSESCLEEGLLRIIRDPAYAGENFAIPQGECAVGVEKEGETYIVRATGGNAQFGRHVVAEAVLDGLGLQVNSWKEE